MKKRRIQFVIAVASAIVLVAAFACGGGKNSSTTAYSSHKTDGGHWAIASSPKNPKDTVIAEVGDAKIYKSDFMARIEKQSPVMRARYNDVGRKKEFVENMVRFELLAMAAIDQGLDKDPDVLRSAKQMMIQKLMRSTFETLSKPEDITDKEIEDYYASHKKDYFQPEKRRVSHILVRVNNTSNPKEWSAALVKATDIRKEAVAACAKDPSQFKTFAKKYSDDKANAALGGDLGYIARKEDNGRMVKEFSDAAFALKKINDISKPVKTKYGYHVIRLTGKTQRSEKSLDEVRNNIRNILHKQARTEAFDKFVEAQQEKYGITIHESALKAIDVNATPAPPITQPNKPVFKQPPNKEKTNYESGTPNAPKAPGGKGSYGSGKSAGKKSLQK